MKSGLIRENIYRQIRADILACDLMPGSHIHENVLAERYEVSKSPVRDALLKLEEQGLVDVIPRKGYRVRPVSANDAKELYEMRLLLERACVRGAIESASDETLKALDRFRGDDDSKTLADWVGYNREFHGAIAAAAGNARLAKATEDVLDQFDRLTFMGVASFMIGGYSETFDDEHCAIIDAIQARDKGRASSLAAAHIKSARRRVLAALENPPIVQ
ncbi:MAG: GntR family transcriptional regulator [Proteobacteria bacterium]|nr:GntR family transcriptional regulator [Pseudomonadota bacterium]